MRTVGQGFESPKKSLCDGPIDRPTEYESTNTLTYFKTKSMSILRDYLKTVIIIANFERSFVAFENQDLDYFKIIFWVSFRVGRTPQDL